MTASWQPSAPLANLRNRARLLKQIRDFFDERGVMEVDTPLMCHTSVTDPFIQSIPALFKAHPDSEAVQHYLQTSPEYAMKRLLAAGSGPIYQISKAFRQGEIGRIHNPEFTMLEWYRPGFDHHALMDEMDALLQHVLLTQPAERKTYAELFDTFLQIDAHHASLDELLHKAKEKKIVVNGAIDNRDTWLNLLMSHYIEPQLGQEKPFFLYDFPASQAALARLQLKEPPVASRFEVYFRGTELANGFHELQDVHEQRARFEKNCLERERLGLPSLPIDEWLLAALAHGLPNCAGVALGIDRLMMLAVKSEKLADVLSFEFTRA